MSINIYLSNLLFSDKMNSRNMILSGAIVALVMLVTTNVFFASSALAVGSQGNVNIGAGLAIYEVKKGILICDQGQSAPQSQLPPELGGCIDVSNQDGGVSGNITDMRFGSYLFGGEQMIYLAVARDLNGATFLPSTATLQIAGSNAVTCTKVDQQTTDSYKSGTPWFGHNLAALLSTLPPAMGVSDTSGFNPQFDALYQCIYTVKPLDAGQQSVTVQVTVGSNSVSTLEEKFWFNPQISISVSFDSGISLTFPAMQAGQNATSLNSLLITNNAMGGVDLATYLVGNDLIDSTGTGLCPTTDVLSVNNLAYRCSVGSYFSERWTPLSTLKEANTCHDLSARQCLVEDNWASVESQVTHGWPQQISDGHNDLIPDASSPFASILYNAHTAQCSFMLHVPLPCQGTFSSDSAVDVLVRAI